MRFDVCIPIPQSLNRDGTPNDWTRSRLDPAIRACLDRDVSVLLLSGGYRPAWIPVTLAKGMEGYAIGRGIAGEDIAVEERALDTVGVAAFAYPVLADRGARRVLVVANPGYIKATPIFDFVLGKDFELTYLMPPFRTDHFPGLDEHEMNGLAAFRRTFEGVRRGDIARITERLFERHPLYAGKDPATAVYSAEP